MQSWEKEIKDFNNSMIEHVNRNINFFIEREIEKSRVGIYKDNVENRRLNRVGQKYGNTVKYEEDEVKLAKKVQSILKKRGINKNPTISRTHFGISVYFYAYEKGNENFNEPLKIRISNHSVTSFNRMQNEEHFTAKDSPIYIANLIEERMYPDRYEEVSIGKKYVDRLTGETVSKDSLINDKQYLQHRELRDITESVFDNSFQNKKYLRNIKKEEVGISKKGNKKYNISFDIVRLVEEKPIKAKKRREDIK